MPYANKEDERNHTKNYCKAYIKRYTVSLSNTKDRDIMDFLENKNKNAYFKSIVLKDMQRNKEI